MLWKHYENWHINISPSINNFDLEFKSEEDLKTYIQNYLEYKKTYVKWKKIPAVATN